MSKGHELFDALAAYNKKISDEADSLAAKVLPNSYKQIGGAMLSYMKGPGITDHQIAEMRGMLNVLSKKFTGKDDIPFPSPEA